MKSPEEWVSEAVDLFAEVATRDATRPAALHEMIVAMHSVCGALELAVDSGVPHLRLQELSAPARVTAAQSIFVERLQTWPRGYPGDFETVDYIMQQRVKSPQGSSGYLIELHSLTCGIVQQHRNKVQAQARHIVDSALRTRDRGGNILVLASGSSPDVEMALPVLMQSNIRLTLVDADLDALTLSKKRLEALHPKISVLHANVLQASSALEALAPFDLVLAGGLFDYLPTKHAIALIGSISKHLLAPDGVFFFTNLSKPNPYHGWMRYVANWRVVERTSDELSELVTRGSSSSLTASVSCDGTGLALLATCKHTS